MNRSECVPLLLLLFFFKFCFYYFFFITPTAATAAAALATITIFIIVFFIIVVIAAASAVVALFSHRLRGGSVFFSHEVCWEIALCMLGDIGDKFSFFSFMRRWAVCFLNLSLFFIPLFLSIAFAVW